MFFQLLDCHAPFVDPQLIDIAPFLSQFVVDESFFVLGLLYYHRLSFCVSPLCIVTLPEFS
jgi:hypothetical protein